MREKVHLLACAQVVFFAVSLVGFLLGVPPAGRGLRLGGPYGSGLAECVSAGACLFPPEVVQSSVFLPEVVALEVPPGGGVWRPDVAIGRWNRPVCRLELAGLRAGSSFVAKKRKL